MKESYYQSGKEIVQNAPQLYMDIDVESDGKAGYGSMLSIGAVSAFGDTFYAEIAPWSQHFILANKDFCEAHGLEREKLKIYGQDSIEAIEEFTDWSKLQLIKYQKAELVFSGYNASYDFPLVDLYCHQAGIENPYGVAGFCTKSLSMALQDTSYDWRKTKKSKLPAEIVPHEEFTHNALEDALWQQRFHFALVGKLALSSLEQYSVAERSL